jgi:hypothetical protein
MPVLTSRNQSRPSLRDYEHFSKVGLSYPECETFDAVFLSIPLPLMFLRLPIKGH